MKLEDLGIFELMEMLIRGTAYLEGCSMDEVRDGVLKQIKGLIIKEIDWVGEMLEK